MQVSIILYDDFVFMYIHTHYNNNALIRKWRWLKISAIFIFVAKFALNDCLFSLLMTPSSVEQGYS